MIAEDTSSGGKVVGSSFIDERSSIAGVGPLTVDPSYQNKGVGRRLMNDVMERARNTIVQITIIIAYKARYLFLCFYE